MYVVLPHLFSLSHDCIGSIIILCVVLIGFLTIDRLLLCRLVQVESNMQYGQHGSQSYMMHVNCSLWPWH